VRSEVTTRLALLRATRLALLSDMKCPRGTVSELAVGAEEGVGALRSR